MRVLTSETILLLASSVIQQRVAANPNDLAPGHFFQERGLSPDGYEFLVSTESSATNTPLCITAPNASPSGGTKLWLSPCNFDAMPYNQLWKFDNEKVRSRINPQRCMVVAAGKNIRNGARLRLKHCDKPRWKEFTWNASKIQVSGKNYCVKHDDSSGRIQVFPCENMSEFEWTSMLPPSMSHRFLVAQASPPKNPMCVTAVKGTKDFGGLYLGKCDTNGMPANQLWKFDGDQFVSSLDDSMCMTVNDGETVRKNFGVNLADCGNNLTRFIWDARNTNYIQVKGKKYFCVSHSGSFADNGDNIITMPCAEEKASKWIFTDSPKEDLVSICPRVSKNHAQENLLHVGENVEDKHIGIVVSMSGNGKRVAVFNQLRDDRGIVQVWDDNDGDWSQSFADIQLVGRVNNEWWYFNLQTISLSGNGKYIAVASPFSNEESGEGQVDVYELENGAASPFGKPVIVKVDSNLRRMAVSFSHDGSRLAVGSNNVVRVYQKPFSDWELLGEELTYSGDVSIYGGRLSLAPGGDTVAIKIIKPNAYGILFSSAHILRFTSESWSQMGQELDFGNWGYGYAASLSYDGNVAVIETQVFTYDKNNDTWSGVAVRDPNYSSTNSISADGHRVVIGSRANRGRVEVFDFDGSNWCKILYQGGAEEGDDFGSTVSLSQDGSRYIVGAPFIEYFHDGLEAYWEVYGIKERD